MRTPLFRLSFESYLVCCWEWRGNFLKAVVLWQSINVFDWCMLNNVCVFRWNCTPTINSGAQNNMPYMNWHGRQWIVGCRGSPVIYSSYNSLIYMIILTDWARSPTSLKQIANFSRPEQSGPYCSEFPSLPLKFEPFELSLSSWDMCF